VVEADLSLLRQAAVDACDLLAERTYGNAARSPGHNARLRLERTLKNIPALTAARDTEGKGETAQDLREENLRSLLREARQYVSDAGSDDGSDVNSHSVSLLSDIDEALGPVSSTDRGSAA
jgi:hypothetical protein